MSGLAVRDMVNPSLRQTRRKRRVRGKELERSGRGAHMGVLWFFDKIQGGGRWKWLVKPYRRRVVFDASSVRIWKGFRPVRLRDRLPVPLRDRVWVLLRVRRWVRLWVRLLVRLWMSLPEWLLARLWPPIRLLAWSWVRASAQAAPARMYRPTGGLNVATRVGMVWGLGAETSGTGAWRSAMSCAASCGVVR